MTSGGNFFCRACWILGNRLPSLGVINGQDYSAFQYLTLIGREGFVCGVQAVESFARSCGIHVVVFVELGNIVRQHDPGVLALDPNVSAWFHDVWIVECAATHDIRRWKSGSSRVDCRFTSRAPVDRCSWTDLFRCHITTSHSKGVTQHGRGQAKADPLRRLQTRQWQA